MAKKSTAGSKKSRTKAIPVTPSSPVISVPGKLGDNIPTQSRGKTISVDEVFARATKDVEMKMTKAGMLVGHDAPIIVLPVPSLAMRYVLQSTGLPLSRCYQLVGEQKSYKSTFAVEMGRWHFICNGRGKLHEAETKPTPDLRNSVLHWQENLLSVEDCKSLEDWMRKVTWFNQAVQKKCELAGGPGRTVPFIQIVDSLLGKACEETIKKVKEKGAPGRNFAMEANHIKTYMQVYPQELLGWPFTFVGINHLKMRTDENGLPHKHVPGGYALKFQAAAHFELRKLGKLQEMSNFNRVMISLATFDSSYGADGKRIEVPIHFWRQEDFPGVWRLYSRWEWWEANILLLMYGVGMPAKVRDGVLKKVKEVIDLHEKPGGSRGKLFWSERLGVPSSAAMPPHDLGVLLEQNQEVLNALYQILDITERPMFQPGVDFMAQQDGYAHVLAQAEASRLRDSTQLNAGRLITHATQPLEGVADTAGVASAAEGDDAELE